MIKLFLSHHSLGYVILTNVKKMESDKTKLLEINPCFIKHDHDVQQQKKSIKLGVQFMWSTFTFSQKKNITFFRMMNGKKRYREKYMCKSFIIKSYNKDFSFELHEVISSYQ
jgi:hypothetical protein